MTRLQKCFGIKMSTSQYESNPFMINRNGKTQYCKINPPIISAFRLAAAQEAAAQHRAGRDWSSFTAMGGPSQSGANAEKAAPGPSSLFVFGENNPIRRYTRFIIEWPYPLMHRFCRIYDNMGFRNCVRQQITFAKKNLAGGKIIPKIPKCGLRNGEIY